MRARVGGPIIDKSEAPLNATRIDRLQAACKAGRSNVSPPGDVSNSQRVVTSRRCRSSEYIQWPGQELAFGPQPRVLCRH